MTSSDLPPRDWQELEGRAAAHLAHAMAEANALHLSGARERLRVQLEGAIECARRVLHGADDPASPKVIARARRTLARGLAARAEDARHGAGQLSRGSQRAPTTRDCDEGWRRVESIVVTAEEAAREAIRVAQVGDDPRLEKSAKAAEDSAQAARQIVEQRNHAYTFHADPGFSFGEGWYLAAAAVLEGVTVQIEPEQRQSEQAERFLRDAGLSEQLVAYRSRPRANKHLTEIVARQFRVDPQAAQRKLRAALLGGDPISPPVADWVERALEGASTGSKVLLWVRYCAHHPNRNTAYSELDELSRRAIGAGLVPVLVGDAVRGGAPPQGTVDLTFFWKDDVFQGIDMRRCQLQFFEYLRQEHALVGQIGVTTAGMDGPALMGLPTMYLTEESNVRMREWDGAVPGYIEIVRESNYLARVSRLFSRWALRTHPRL